MSILSLVRHIKSKVAPKLAIDRTPLDRQINMLSTENAALRTEASAANRESLRLREAYRLSAVYHRPIEQTSGSPAVTVQTPTDDSALISRIMTSYRAACETEIGDKDSFWQTDFARIKRADHEVLLGGNHDAVTTLLRNPALSRLFIGFDELHDHTDLPEHGIAHVISHHGWIYDSLLRLAEAIGARHLNYPEILGPGPIAPPVDEILSEIDRVVGFRVTFPNPFPGEIGLLTSRGVASFRSVQSLCQAYRTHELVGTDARVLEIGGGLGRTAFYARQFGIRDYTIIDLPMTNVAQGYFLGRTLGQDMVSLFEENQHGIRILPPTEFLDTTDRYDLVVNVDSLTEMSRDTALAYCKAIQSRANKFLSINHECNPFTVREICATLAMHSSTRTPYWLRRGYVDEVFYLV
ncbi:putative sugar O-methyltransferase [Paraburkholderia sediminicola]|uniref:putative sugar O-methyltransferase n=1 Tax=Paraburkholderia sediminicola TaxID=458836 RepID=UPI0038BDEBE8